MLRIILTVVQELHVNNVCRMVIRLDHYVAWHSEAR